MAKTHTVGRSPDYNLSFLDKGTDQRGRVGAGWRNDDGSISIKLNVKVVLAESPDLILTLFLRDENYERAHEGTPERVDGGSVPPDV